MNAAHADLHAALSILREIKPEAVVLAGGFQEEVAILQTRSRWPNTVRVIAAVAAGMPAFGSQLPQASGGIIGPSHWEPSASSSTILGPPTEWFMNNFQKQFGTTPDYIAAGSFAAGLIMSECVRRSGSLDSDQLRSTAARLECHTFYGCYRIDPHSGKQLGHRILLVQWQKGSKISLQRK